MSSHFPLTKNRTFRFSLHTYHLSLLKGEVRRKMNFTYVSGFVVLRDVVKVFPVCSSLFTTKTTGGNRARSHSGAWRGLKTKWDLKLSPTYFIRYLFIEVGTTSPKLKLDAFQLWQLRSLNFQSFSDPSEIRWRARGAREVPAPRDWLNFRRASLFSRNEFESGTFTIVLQATSSFTYVSVIYGANISFKWSPIVALKFAFRFYHVFSTLKDHKVIFAKSAISSPIVMP